MIKIRDGNIVHAYCLTIIKMLDVRNLFTKYQISDKKEKGIYSALVTWGMFYKVICQQRMNNFFLLIDPLLTKVLS